MLSTDFTSSGLAAGTPAKGSGVDGGGVARCWAGALPEEDWEDAFETARIAAKARNLNFMAISPGDGVAHATRFCFFGRGDYISGKRTPRKKFQSELATEVG